jgi:hypothetical protein
MKGEKIEFEYPSPPEHPRGLFRLIVGNRATGLLFANGGYEYEISESLAGRAMIDVSKDQQSIASITCTTASDTLTLTTTQQKFKEIGLSE